MDSRIGPELLNNRGCGYTTDRNHRSFCGAKPVVRHFLFDQKEPDGYYPSGYTCEAHVDMVPMDIILMHHPVSFFCQKPGSRWSFEENECVMDIKEYEQILFGTTSLGDDIVEEFNHAGN